MKVYVMQTKLTLRVDDAIIRKAKKIASKRGTSVSRIFSEHISEIYDGQNLEDLGETTRSKIGLLRGADIMSDRDEYREHLKAKYL